MVFEMATEILFVRHARAEDQHPLGDAARGLDQKGRRQFHEQAPRLAKKFQIKKIVTSPLVRAAQTAEILAGASDALEVDVRGELARTARDVAELAAESASGSALVGHNPSLSDAVRILTGDTEVPELKKGCGLALSRHGDRWKILWRTDL